MLREVVRGNTYATPGLVVGFYKMKRTDFTKNTRTHNSGSSRRVCDVTSGDAYVRPDIAVACTYSRLYAQKQIGSFNSKAENLCIIRKLVRSEQNVMLKLYQINNVVI